MDPFKITGPTAISFSGGRTSAYMLWRFLQANGGTLPDEAKVLFANTGKEEEATLCFVRDCEQQWNVPITWVEYRNDALGYAVVDFDTASRAGEPFEAIIRKRNHVPNPVTRYCTSELKIRTMHKWIRAHTDWTDWEQAIGIRADEQRRVAKIRARGRSTESSHETMRLPLADAGVTIAHIDAFWSAQPFHLELPTVNGKTLAGNCDLCFLKGGSQVQSLIRQTPTKAIWWARMEALALAASPDGARFRTDRPSYQQMLDQVGNQPDMFGDAIECYCGE